MKSVITFIIALSTLMVYSQDPLLQKNNPKLDNEATKLTQAYNDQLVLTGKQFMLFQKKVEEFLIRRETIENDYTGTEKLNMLYRMQKRETAEMGNILTQAQMNLYKKIKPNIQPLDEVEN